MKTYQVESRMWNDNIWMCRHITTTKREAVRLKNIHKANFPNMIRRIVKRVDDIVYQERIAK